MNVWPKLLAEEAGPGAISPLDFKLNGKTQDHIAV